MQYDSSEMHVTKANRQPNMDMST